MKESTLESLRLNDDLHRSILVHERDADAGVVPLEEALIVNDPARTAPPNALHAHRGARRVPGAAAGG